MKRRTRPALPRPPRPDRAPSLARLLPDVLKMSDIDGYKKLYLLSVMCSEGADADLVSVLFAEFLAIRGLSIHPTDERHAGGAVVELRKAGVVLASFSSALL